MRLSKNFREPSVEITAIEPPFAQVYILFPPCLNDNSLHVSDYLFPLSPRPLPLYII